MLKINRMCVLAVPALLLATACPDLSLAQNVSIWMTTDNQRTELKQQPSISFSAGSSGSTPTVFVDETEGYQSIEGFGASFTDSAAYLLNEKVPASQLNSVMTSLFDHANGIGVSFVRNPMGASDLARYDYSYDDMPAGQTDPNLTNFSIAHDLVDIVPLVKLAKQICRWYMICPVEIARDMSAFRAVRIRDHAKHGFLFEVRYGAGDEST